MDELLNAHADPSHKDKNLDGWMAGWLDFQDVAVCFYPARPSNLGVLRLFVYL